MTLPIVAMRGIVKRFPGVQALDSVDFEAGAGEVVALVGENGAGKSTLMKILGGVVRPDAGSIRIDARAVELHSAADATLLGIAFIHQELDLLDNLDLAGNVFLGREPLRGGFLRLVDRRALREATRRCLDLVGLDLPPETQLARLAVAQRQLVAIARALAVEARVVVMDEPTSSLTLGETRRLHAIIRDLRGRGASVIYISHRLGEVEGLADRVVVLRDGRRVGTLCGREIEHDAMVRLMVGRDLSRFYPPRRGAEREGGLEVRELRTRRYPNRRVSFEARRGEILGVAGLVGAGRTELAEALFGIRPALGGTIALDGRPLAIRSPRDAMRSGLFLVPEDRRQHGLVLEMTLRENITLPSARRFSRFGILRPAEERRAADAERRALKIKAPSVEVPASALSGGNQQKVVLAKGLLREPAVVLFDEPTRGIDVGARAEIYTLMRDLAARGAAIVMISSDMEEILGASDRIAVLHEGELTGILPRERATEEAVLALAVGRPLEGAGA